MDAKIKQLFDSTIELIDKAGVIFDVEEMGNAARLEMAKYLMYLSASDGEIKYSEAKVISEVLGATVNPGKINEILREHNIYSTEFESTAPVVFRALVELDNKIYQSGDAADSSASELMVTLYKGIGIELLQADGDVDDSEKNDIVIFVEMLEDYLNEHLLSRSSGIKFTNSKSGSSVSAPTKSGVSAPKKG